MKKFLVCLLLLLVPAISQAQINTLVGTGESITLELSGAAATTNPTYITTYMQSGVRTKIGRTNGATPVTAVAGVAAGPTQVTSLMVHNADTAAVTLLVKKISAATTYQMMSLTLPSLSTMMWTAENGVRVVDNGGQTMQTLSSGLMTASIGASTAAAGTTTSDAGVLPAATATTYPTTAADGTKGVRVHANDKVTGRMLFIANGVSNQILKVYAPSGGTINGAAADAAFSSVSGKGVIIQCIDSAGNTWRAW